MPHANDISSWPYYSVILGVRSTPPNGADEKAVFDELCQIVEEAIALYHNDGKPLPRPLHHFANTMENVVWRATAVAQKCRNS